MPKVTALEKEAWGAVQVEAARVLLGHQHHENSDRPRQPAGRLPLEGFHGTHWMAGILGNTFHNLTLIPVTALGGWGQGKVG